MSGPWEKYRKKEAQKGPWERYKKAVPVTQSGEGKTDREMPSTDIAADVAKSGATGVAKGAISLAGMVGDTQDLASKAASWVAGKFGASPETQSTAGQWAGRLAVPVPGAMLAQLPSSADMQGAIEGVTGEFYKPQTTAGEYAQTIGEFAPGALMGPGSLARKAAMTAVPAVASETAGQMTEGESIEPYARVLAALTGGVATAGFGSNPAKQIDKVSKTPVLTLPEVQAETKRRFDELKNAGIKFDADRYSQFVDDLAAKLQDSGLDRELTPKSNRVLARMEEMKGGNPEFSDMHIRRKLAGNVSGDFKESNTERALSGTIKRDIDNFIQDGATSEGTVTGQQAGQMLRDANEMARRKIIAEDLMDMKRKSESYVSGEESGLRNQLSSYQKSEGQGLTAPENQQIQKLIRREGLLNVANALSGRIGTAATGGTGAALGAGLGSLAMPGVGTVLGALLGGGASMAGSTVMRSLMEAKTKKQFDEVLKTVLAGRETQEQALSASQKNAAEAIARALLLQQSARSSAFGERAAVPAIPAMQ